MDISEAPSRLPPIAEELLENRYARENLRTGGEKLRDAYRRAQKRRVRPSRDRKLRRQLEAAITALDEGTAALAGGRRKPRRTGRRVALSLLVLAAAGAAAALALNEELRHSVLGSARALGGAASGAPEQDGSGGSAP